jgi:hypothetical protein
MIPVMITPSQALFILAAIALIAGLKSPGRIWFSGLLYFLSIVAGLWEWWS